MWKFIGTAVLGGIISLIIRRLFDKRLDRLERKALYGMRSFRHGLLKLKIAPYLHGDFRIGKWRTEWITLEGSSSDPYSPSNVVCQLDPTPINLPPDRLQKKREIEEFQAQLELAGNPREFHDGATVALTGIARGQIGVTEEPFLVLRLRPSSFYNYLATTQCLDEEIETDGSQRTTVRDKYLRDLRYESPNPEFVAAFAINLSLITKDGFIVIGKRGTVGMFPYGGCISPAINECVQPDLDKIAGSVSLFAAAKRGAHNELNIQISEDELQFFTLGVDTRYYSYLLTGLVRSKTYTRDDIIARRTQGSKERWETDHLYFLPLNAESIAKSMSEISKIEKWSPVSIVCLAQTLISEFGTKNAERALSKYAQQFSP